MVQVALRRRRKEALGAVAEIGRGDRTRSTGNELVVLREPAEIVDRLDHGGVVERDLVTDPLVIGLRGRVAQHQILDPVGRGPAGRTAGTKPDAPGRAAIGHDLFGQRLEVLHRLGHLIARVVEVVRDVPDQRFHVDLVGEGIEGIGAVLALVGAKLHPAVTRRVIVLDPGGRLFAQGCQKALGGEIGNQTRLRQHRDIGRRAGLGVDDDLLLVILGRGIIDRSAGRSREIGKNAFDQRLIFPTPRPEDLHRLPAQIIRGGESIIARPVETGVLAGFEFQVLSRSGPGKKRQRGDARVERPCHAILPIGVLAPQLIKAPTLKAL